MSASGSGKYDLIDRLAEEFAARFRNGERPALSEYTTRYPELAEDIRELFPALVEMEQAEEDLREPTERPLAARVPPLDRVGDYRILREIGRGGMGVVYEAEQVSLGRRVALKVLPLQASKDGKALARFKREARAAAKLHHTNIVPVFEVGQDGEVCYYAMQFIQGQGLDQVVEEVRRLRAASLANGEHEADDLAGPEAATRQAPRSPAPHSPGKELAQSLLTGQFQVQEPVIPTSPPGRLGSADPIGVLTVDLTRRAPAPGADGGQLASATASAVLPGQVELSNASSHRSHYFASVARIGRQAALALAYAHARGIIHRDIKPSNLLLDAAGVVWVTDFGLAKTEDDGLTNPGDLVGTLRFMAPERFHGECDARADVYALGLTLYELLVLRRAFQARDRLGLIDQIKGEEPARPRSLDPRIPRDLETIVLKAMDKDPNRRYASAEEMAEDLHRFLADEPILARRASRAERLARWARRNKGLAVSLAVIAFLLVAAALASSVGVFLLRAANRREHAARLDAENQRDEIRYHLYVANMGLAQREWANGNAAHVRELLDAGVPRAAGEKDLRGWEWYYLDRLRHADLRTLQGHKGDVNFVTYSPDGSQIASAGDDGTVRLWDVVAGTQSRVLTGHVGDVLSLAFSPDGKRLASGGRDRTVRLWDLTAGNNPRVLTGFKGRVSGLAFGPGGKWLAIAGDDRSVRLWNVAAGDWLRVLSGHQAGIEDLAVRTDGKRLATAGGDGTVRVWDVTGKEEPRILTGHLGKVCGVAFSPDGERLASAGDDHTVRVWDVAASRVLRVLKGHMARVMSLAYSPDGIRLASTSIDGTVRLWNAVTGKELRILRGHTGEVNRVAYSPDGTQLASAGDDETVRVWDAGGGEQPRALRGPSDGISGLAFRPDGAHLASSSHDGTVRLWDVVEGRELRTLRAHAGGVRKAAYSPDGSRLVSVGKDSAVCVRDAAGDRVLRAFPGPRGGVQAVAFSADGKRLGLAAKGRTVWVWDASGSGEPRAFKGHSLQVMGVAFHPDGTRLASASKDGTVRVWDLAGSAPPVVLKGHRASVICVAYSPDGAWLASGGRDGMIRLWDVAAAKAVRGLQGHTGRVDCLVFSPDGTRLASGGRDGTVRVWDPIGGGELCVLKNHDLDVECVAFSPDGRWLVSGGSDRTIRLADARPWTKQAPDEQEALGLVEGLFARPLRQAEVVQRLRGHKGISEPVRRRALELAARFPDSPDRFHQACANVVRYPDLSTTLYKQALGWAETARALAPGADYLTTRGIAQYRLGRHGDALETLRQADQRHQNSLPADLAFLAMAHHQLGHAGDASAALKRLREIMKQPFVRGAEEALVFWAEAEALLRSTDLVPRK
jgi:WD40 repeat protein/serine/threonine protein kinase